VALYSKGDYAKAVEAYRFNEAADTIYQFVWNIYCDWYLEFIKPVLSESEETKQVARYVLYQALHVLAPFMPFITEELNAKIFNQNTHLTGAGWPSDIPAGSADTGLSLVVDIISEIRAIRSEMNVPLSAKPPLLIAGITAEKKAVLEAMQPALLRMARLSEITFTSASADEFEKGTARTNLHSLDLGLALAGILDFDAEKARLDKEIKACEGEIKKLSAKLSNEGFLSKAPEQVVAENKRRLSEEEERINGLQSARSRLDV